MDPYEELLAKREQLDAEIMSMRAAKRPEVVAQIGRLMLEYEIGIPEIEDWQGRQEGDRRRGRVAPRYLDPKTGATWSGRGKRPRWMAGHDPEEFRIRSGESEPAPAHDELTRALYGTGVPGAKMTHGFGPTTIRKTK